MLCEITKSKTSLIAIRHRYNEMCPYVNETKQLEMEFKYNYN